MKRILSIFVVCFIVMGVCVNAQTTSPALSRLIGLGIMQGDENGDFNEFVGVTRAEFCAMTARILQIDGADLGLSSVFSDVLPGHWANSSVYMLYGMGIVNGRSAGIFDPDAGVTFNEAVKILVASLGYNGDAVAAGDYPQGYLITAAGIGLFKGVKAVDGEITRLTAAELINAAIDIVPMTVWLGNGGQRKNNMTLYDYLINGGNVIKVRGIITAAGNFSIENEFDTRLKKGNMKIDDFDGKANFGEYGGLIYKTAVDYSDYIGMSVEGYARYDEREEIYTVVNLEPSHDNEVVTAATQDAEVFGNYIEYTSEGSTATRKVSFATDVTFVYNGRVILEPAAEDLSIYYGQYRTIDNNGDGLADVVFIDEAESFVVERTRRDDRNGALYFANKCTYRGSNRFDFEFDNEDKIYDIEDSKGNTLSFEDITEGQGVTFVESIDRSYARLVLCSETVTGTVEGLSYDDSNNSISVVTINGKDYNVALGKDGVSRVDVKLGDEGTYVFDVYSNIIDFWGEKLLSFEYAYVVGAAYTSGLSGTLQLKLVQGVQPTIEEKVTNGVTSYTYYLQNDLIKLYECVKNVRFKAQTAEVYVPAEPGVPAHMGTGLSPWNWNTFDVLNGFEDVTLEYMNMTEADLANKLIGFSLNADGKIKEIYIFDIPLDGGDLGDAMFNARIPAFGGSDMWSNVGRGYLVNSQTMYICVPNNPRGVDDDYYMRVTVGHNTSNHSVYGTRIFYSPVQDNLPPDAKRELMYSQPVDVVVIKSPMDSISPTPVSENADVCIVTKITSAVSTSGINEGESVIKLEMLNGEKVVYEYTSGSGRAYDNALALITGDLIRYNKDAFGRIANLEMVGRIQGCGDDYFSGINKVYGLAESIQYDMYDCYGNIMIDKLTLYCDNYGTQSFKIPVENTPPVYMYERGHAGWISSADTEKIMTALQSGSAASRVFIYLNNNEVIKAIVIIE